MTEDELIINIRAGTIGVKQGVATALAEFKKLGEQKRKLEEDMEDIKLKVSTPELAKLHEEFKGIQDKKRELETAVGVPFKADNVEELKAALSAVEAERAALEQRLEIPIDAPDYLKIIERLNELKGAKEELAAGLSMYSGTEDLADSGAKLAAADKFVLDSYRLDKKAYDLRKSLTELSLDEQIAAWEQLKAKYARYADIVLETDTQLYALRRQQNDEWYKDELSALDKLSRGMAERTDIAALIQKLQTLKQEAARIYEDYPERSISIQKELDEAIIAREEDRANKIMRINANAVDELIAAQERRVAVGRQMSGLVIDGEEYSYDSGRSAEAYQQSIKYLDSYIEELQSREKSLTDEEYRELQARLKQRQSYYEKLEDLHISALKEEQEAEKKAAEEAKKALEQEIKDKTEAAKKANQEIIAGIKERYAEEIRLAEEAANAEISIYEQRIKVIDSLLKSEARADTDAGQLDRINRLQEQLAYEIDPGNRYELEKQIAQEQEDYDKRKRKESLEDERESLKEQISAVKDSLAARKEELQAYRDQEIRLAEESYNAFVENLNAQSLALKEKEKADTETVKKELNIRTGENEKFLLEKRKQLEISGREERSMMSQTTSGIISDLFSRIWEFAEAGRRAGQAYASAFQSAVSEIEQNMSASAYSHQSSNMAVSALSASSGGDVLYLPEPVSVELNNYYNVPVVTPSQAAADAKTGIEQALRYI